MKEPFYNIKVKDKDIDIVEKLGITSFSFESSTEKDNLVKLQGTISFKNTSILDEQWLQKGTEIVYFFGYKGAAQSEVHRAVITEINVNFGLTISISIDCLDKGQYLKKGTNNKVWENVKASDIVGSIAKNYDLETVIDTTDFTYISKPQGNMNDFDFIKKLSKESNKTFFITDNTLHFKDRDLAKSSTVTYTYGNGDSKIKSFSPKLKGTDDKGVGSSAKVVGINNADNKEVSEVLDVQKTGKNDLGNVKGTFNYNKNGVETYKGGVATVTNDVPEIEKKKLQNKVENEQLNSLEATLTLEGEPKIKVTDIITMSGLPQKFVGNYYVSVVSHSISSSGYETVVQLKKNATNKTITNNQNKSADPNNKTIGANAVKNEKVVKKVSYNANGKKK